MGKGINQSVTIDLDGNLPGRSKQFGRALSQMGERGERHLGRMARMSRTAGRSIDRLGNRYTALLSGAAIAAATKQVGDLSERYTRLGINANLSERQVQDLKQSVFDVSQAPDIRVDPAEMLSAIEDIVEKTGDLDFAKANIENIGLAIQATGATGANVGAMLAEFQKQGITAPGEVLKVIDSLNLQGKEGAFTLKDLAQLGPRVVSAYNATGRSGVQAMKEMGAALQVIRMGTDSSATAATAFEATLRTLSDPKKIEQLKELGGVEVFDPELLKQGKQQLKPINELMVEIIKASGGKQTNLGQIFDGEAMRAFNTIWVSSNARVWWSRLIALSRFRAMVRPLCRTPLVLPVSSIQRSLISSLAGMSSPTITWLGQSRSLLIFSTLQMRRPSALPSIPGSGWRASVVR